jgi:hypothetical protein
MDFTLRSHVMSPEANAEGLTITPNPVPVTAGTVGEHYLANPGYGGQLNDTIVNVVG